MGTSRFVLDGRHGQDHNARPEERFGRQEDGGNTICGWAKNARPMETTEKIVESYCRYVRQWFTIPNIRCDGQHEIDLLAVDTKSPQELRRFHIGCGVSISGSYSKLTDKPFSNERLRVRVEQAGQRRTIGFFIERKFQPKQVLAELTKYGFVEGNYRKVIVSWGATGGAKAGAARSGIEVWDFRDLLQEIADAHRDRKAYFTDDTARTIQLFAMAAASRASTRA
jgi:hypothetical protein